MSFNVNKLILVGLFFVLFSFEQAQAQSRGGRATAHSLGFSLSLTGGNQSDVNSWVGSLNQVGTKELGSAYEFMFDYQYRFSRSMFAFLARPTYYTQSADGGGVSSALTGYTLFPMLRIYPLENSFIQFFLQMGLGYGSVNLDLSQSGVTGSYSNSAFGALGGIGANFCFTSNHCLVVEGNLRYLPIQRLTGSANGSLGGNITQTAGELEKENVDLGVTLSGVQGIIGYRLVF